MRKLRYKEVMKPVQYFTAKFSNSAGQNTHVSVLEYKEFPLHALRPIHLACLKNNLQNPTAVWEHGCHSLVCIQ